MSDSNGKGQAKNARLAPEVNKIIFVRNLPYKITSEELYDVFGRFGPIRQIRKGKTAEKKGTAFIVYEDTHDANNAVENLNGSNVQGRCLVALSEEYYLPSNRWGAGCVRWAVRCV